MTGTMYGIVAGYEGSRGAAQALHWAAREARARGTALLAQQAGTDHDDGTTTAGPCAWLSTALRTEPGPIRPACRACHARRPITTRSARADRPARTRAGEAARISGPAGTSGSFPCHIRSSSARPAQAPAGTGPGAGQ